MSDKKQMIIDGMDVSKCGHFYIRPEDRAVCCTDHVDCHCAANPNCYFKQLSRKTQECKKLNEDLDAAREFNNKCMEAKNKLYDMWREQLDKSNRLEKECEELRKELNGSEKWRIKAESLNEKLSIEKYRYRKAFEEIEEYVQSQLDGFGNDVYLMNKAVINKILDIINKAKGNN